jgi:hypothetical protein
LHGGEQCIPIVTGTRQIFNLSPSGEQCIPIVTGTRQIFNLSPSEELGDDELIELAKKQTSSKTNIDLNAFDVQIKVKDDNKNFFLNWHIDDSHCIDCRDLEKMW